MVCCHHFALAPGCESAFSVDPTAITFGRGCLSEVGEHVRALSMSRVAVVTDPRVAKLELFEAATSALRAAQVEHDVFDEVVVEPTDASFQAAAQFAKEGRFDGFVSIGGGSVIDTAKAANLYATHPAAFLDFVNAPGGAGKAVPGPLLPHLACPTTSGTGSECTGIAVFDFVELKAKTGIAHKHLKPTRALIDTRATETLPPFVVASSGFDVLCHALESFTARPFSARAQTSATARPMSQGANPWSDIGCREALRLCGLYLERAVEDAADVEARENMMWAATLAGIAFGNAGVHIPHAMAYSVAGLMHTYEAPDYPGPMVPHGVSVVVNAPAAFRLLREVVPQRLHEAAQLLGGPDASGRIAAMMKACGLPNGIEAIGYGAEDVALLTKGAIVQRRLLDNAPTPVDEGTLEDLYRGSMRCW